MRKVTTITAVLVFFLSVSPVFAAEPWSFGQLLQSLFQPSPSTRSEIRQFVPTIKPTVWPTSVSQKNPTPRQTRAQNQEQEQIQNRIQNFQDFAGRMLDNYERRLQTYEEFLDKVKTRRDKLEDLGRDVTRLNAFIDTAEGNLEDAQSVFDAAETTLTGLDFTQDPATIKKAIRDELTKLRTAFTTLHKSMSQTVQEIVQSGNQQEATTTVKPKPNKPSVTPKAGGQGQGQGGGQGNRP